MGNVLVLELGRRGPTANTRNHLSPCYACKLHKHDKCMTNNTNQTAQHYPLLTKLDGCYKMSGKRHPQAAIPLTKFGCKSGGVGPRCQCYSKRTAMHTPLQILCY